MLELIEVQTASYLGEDRHHPHRGRIPARVKRRHLHSHAISAAEFRCPDDAAVGPLDDRRHILAVGNFSLRRSGVPCQSRMARIERTT
jgi:hypothetical protein